MASQTTDQVHATADCEEDAAAGQVRYYTSQQLANRCHVSPRMIERIFMNHPLVVRADAVGRGEQRVGLRIPEAVAKQILPES